MLFATRRSGIGVAIVARRHRRHMRRIYGVVRVVTHFRMQARRHRHAGTQANHNKNAHDERHAHIRLRFARPVNAAQAFLTGQVDTPRME